MWLSLTRNPPLGPRLAKWFYASVLCSLGPAFSVIVHRVLSKPRPLLTLLRLGIRRLKAWIIRRAQWAQYTARSVRRALAP